MKSQNLLGKLSNLEKKQIKNLYSVYGYSASELGKQYGYTARSIQRYLKNEGVIRTKKESFLIAIERGRMTYNHLMPDEKTKARRKTINPGLRFKVLKKYNFTCACCGKTAKDGAKLQIDHIKQLCDGGTNDESNLQVLCLECNVGKYQQNPFNWGKREQCDFLLT